MPTVVGPAVSPQKSAVEELMEQADEVVAKLRVRVCYFWNEPVETDFFIGTY